MKALIIIDMLNGFCRKGYPLSLHTSTQGIEKYIAKQISKFLKNSDKVVFVCDSHNNNDPEIGRPYPRHCMKGSQEAEIIEDLKPFIKDSVLFYKNTLSILFNNHLDEYLNQIKPTEIEITGVCTDICVLFAVYELRIRGYNVFVSNKGVLPLDKTKQNEFLNYFENRLGAKIDYK